MTTQNKGDLEDFSILVSWAQLKYQHKFGDWLELGGQVNALFNFGTDNITKRDALTGSGPIYEGNLWNPRLMNGSADFSLPQLYAKLLFGDHEITFGSFLKDTPTINAEPWPFPNAVRGVWYDFKQEKTFRLQLAALTDVSSRFSGEFAGIGASIGVGPLGVDANGQASPYRDNTDSGFLGLANLNFTFSPFMSLDVWDYYVDNVSNTVLVEPTLNLDGDVTLKSMLILQQKVGDGGNPNPALQYMVDDNALYFGLRAEKKTGNHTLQLNFSRISDAGRLLLPREWGKEPFYTFQRRTRVEGLSDVTSIMAKWQMDWSGENRDMRLFVTVGSNNTSTVNDFARNKYIVPSAVHNASSFKYTWKTGTFKGLSAELYLAYRILVEDINGVENFRINRADFFHTDFILGYRLFQ